MKNPKRIRKRFFISLLVLITILVFLQTGYIIWNTADPSKTCASCHEIRPSYDKWASSAHRASDCKTCHGTALSKGMRSIKDISGRILRHFSHDSLTEVRLNEKQVGKMVDLCAECHQNEFSKWLTGGHSMRFTDVFLNQSQNKKVLPDQQCLHCHGMFYEGPVDELVSPVDTTGPWHIVSSMHEVRYAMPCLACHSIHTPGLTRISPDYANPEQKAYNLPATYPKAGFYDNITKRYFRADELSPVHTLQEDTTLLVSEDPLMRICFQCHTPDASHHARTVDDHLPAGVHEGLSCTACHQTHANDAMKSCRLCHPAISNCGLDVEKMNTTFADPGSPNDIHKVSCMDCHPGFIRKQNKPD
ncbi:MAG: NapC/NirT family cytochrome c [Bacteroidales bacterium]|nr:NapC/NirT family cytochrome c [Bacteroidales bacterium]MBN2762354.1 NapC/NirT family cytochrome c [Bacteroidales bacterium]